MQSKFENSLYIKGDAHRRAYFVVLLTLVAAAFVAFNMQARADESRGRLKALVVSQSRFDDSGLNYLLGNNLSEKLKVVDGSARAVEKALKKIVGDENRHDVDRSVNAERDAILNEIKEKARDLGEEDAFVVYFCGFAAATPKKDDLLLWTKDTKRGDDSTALSTSQIRQILEKAGSRKTLLLVDAQTYGRDSWEAPGKTGPGVRELGPALGEEKDFDELHLTATDGADVATLLSSYRPLKNGAWRFGLKSLDDKTIFSSLVALGLSGFADRSAVGKVSVIDLIKFVENGLKAACKDDVALWGAKNAKSFELVANYKLGESDVVEGLAAFTLIYAAVERNENGKNELKMACPDFDCSSIPEGTNLPAFKDSKRYVGERLREQLKNNDSDGVAFTLDNDHLDDCDLVFRNTVESKGEKGFLYKMRVERYESEIYALIRESSYDENTTQTATPPEDSVPETPEGAASRAEPAGIQTTDSESQRSREKLKELKLAKFPGTVAVLVDGKERAQRDASDGKTKIVELNPGETYSIRITTNDNLLRICPGGIGIAILVDGRTTLIKRTDYSTDDELKLEDFPFVKPDEAPFYVVEGSGESYIFNGYVCLDSKGGRHRARAFTVSNVEEDDYKRNIINNDSVGTISLWFYELKKLDVERNSDPTRNVPSKTDLGQNVKPNVKTTIPRKKKDGGKYSKYSLLYEPNPKR